jgi:hypothetical protein
MTSFPTYSNTPTRRCVYTLTGVKLETTIQFTYAFWRVVEYLFLAREKVDTGRLMDRKSSEWQSSGFMLG